MSVLHPAGRFYSHSASENRPAGDVQCSSTGLTAAAGSCCSCCSCYRPYDCSWSEQVLCITAHLALLAWAKPTAAARAPLPYATKPGWATKWRRHLDFTINHACWCNNSANHDRDFKCAATPHTPNIGDHTCFQNYSGPADAKAFAEFMVSMNVDSVQLEAHPDSGWVTYW